jgi:hypothetical protein
VYAHKIGLPNKSNSNKHPPWKTNRASTLDFNFVLRNLRIGKNKIWIFCNIQKERVWYCGKSSINKHSQNQ